MRRLLAVLIPLALVGFLTPATIASETHSETYVGTAGAWSETLGRGQAIVAASASTRAPPST
jgi:hypothetical protein